MRRLALLSLGGLSLVAVVYVFFVLGGEDEPLPTPTSGGTSRPAPPPARVLEPIPDTSVPDFGEVPPYPYRPPPWKREMRERLAKTKVTLRLKNRPLPEVLAELSRVLPFPVLLDDTVKNRNREITFVLNGQDGNMAVRVIEHLTRLSHYLEPGAIRLTREPDLPEPTGPEAVVAAIERAREILKSGGRFRPPLDKTLPIWIDDDSVWRAAKQVGQRIGVPVEILAEPDDALKRARVTIESDTMSLRGVLDEIAGAGRLSWAVDGRRIVITAHWKADEIRARGQAAEALAEKEVHFAWDATPLFRVAEDIAEAAGVPVHVDRALWEPDHPYVDLRPGTQALSRTLIQLDAELEAAHYIAGDAIYLVRP